MRAERTLEQEARESVVVVGLALETLDELEQAELDFFVAHVLVETLDGERAHLEVGTRRGGRVQQLDSHHGLDVGPTKQQIVNVNNVGLMRPFHRLQELT